MSDIIRVIFAIIIPPLAVADKGIDKLAITTILWFTTGIGGSIAAFYFLLDGSQYDRWKAQQFGSRARRYNDMPPEKIKRAPREYIETYDGDQLEVVDTRDEERRDRLSRR